ncbi:MAG: hypothetical protein R3E86_00105 [Pseudomonadales bacterium]
MLLMDEPDHRRLRSLVSASFTPAAVERWRPRIREVVQRVLDDIATEEFDLIADFAGPVPTVVIAEMLGIDANEHAQFKIWSDQSVQAGFNPFATEAARASRDQARAALDAFFRREIAARRATPGKDLISEMLRAGADGDRLSEQEMVQQCFLLLVAGNVTTTDLGGEFGTHCQPRDRHRRMPGGPRGIAFHVPRCGQSRPRCLPASGALRHRALGYAPSVVRWRPPPVSGRAPGARRSPGGDSRSDCPISESQTRRARSRAPLDSELSWHEQFLGARLTTAPNTVTGVAKHRYVSVFVGII